VTCTEYVTWVAGVPSSQALPGYLITAPPSVCDPDVIGALAVWIVKKKSCIHPSRHDFPISPSACPSSGWTANPIRAVSGTQILLKGHHQSITSTKELQKNRVQKCQMTGSATRMGLYSDLAPSLVQDNQSSVSTSPLSFGNLMSQVGATWHAVARLAARFASARRDDEWKHAMW